MGKSVENFIDRLKTMSGTGNGIGINTVKKIEAFAFKEGFIKEKPTDGNQ